MNNGMKARTRVRSIAATLELVSMTTKYVTEAATITPVVTWDRFDSLTNPVVNDTTITTTAAAITPIANRAARQRIWHRAAMGAQAAPERDVLHQSQRHADRRSAEAVVESGVGLQQAGDQRADEGTESDAEIE